MWKTITLISSPFALIAFIIAVFFDYQKKKELKKIQLIQKAPKDDQASLINSLFVTYKLKDDNLSKKQKYELLVKEIEKKEKEFKIKAVVSVIISVILAVIVITQILYSGNKSGPNGQIPKNGKNRPKEFFNIKSGDIGYSIDTSLRCESITYQLYDNSEVVLFPPKPVEIQRLNTFFDLEENTWKINSKSLLGTAGAEDDPAIILAVPQHISLLVSGLKKNDRLSIHVFTDLQYTSNFSGPIVNGKAKVTVQVGSPGFTGYLDLNEPRKPVLPGSMLQKNYIRTKEDCAPINGPVAAVIFTAANGTEPPRRSCAYLLIRCGMRSPDDAWCINNNLPLAYVQKDLPPLVVYQSPVNAHPPILQGIFASTLDGSETYMVSPLVTSQNTLMYVNPGPPATVFFLSNFETKSTRICYQVKLDGELIKEPTRVPRGSCQQPDNLLPK